MDTKKIGDFLKKLRKEKGLTQEMLADEFLVSARTVSRWETGTNMPDLSILIQLAEFYNVEIKEILDGERKSEIMEKELEETLFKVADYNKLEKEKVEKAGNMAFGLTFFVCVAAIIIQLFTTVNLSVVAGETVTLLIGGIAYITIMVYNGVWQTGVWEKNNGFKDCLISVICSGIFTVILAACYIHMGANISKVSYILVGFFLGITVIAFVVLRILAYCNLKRKERNSIAVVMGESRMDIKPVQLYIADGNLQADMIVEALKNNNIRSYKQDLGDAGFAAARYGMGRGINDRVAIFVPAGKESDAMIVIEEMGLSQNKS